MQQNLHLTKLAAAKDLQTYVGMAQTPVAPVEKSPVAEEVTSNNDVAVAMRLMDQYGDSGLPPHLAVNPDSLDDPDVMRTVLGI